ncbi:unnamed protein product [Periconia digitata]|uniref:Uncharacterized protein n=1 Tax=Periconia digitata TaxID=1303443 RepID=A0A9W4XHL1_9PLEO|nr:unnamed protein product [Periconia digitata]
MEISGLDQGSQSSVKTPDGGREELKDAMNPESEMSRGKGAVRLQPQDEDSNTHSHSHNHNSGVGLDTYNDGDGNGDGNTYIKIKLDEISQIMSQRSAEEMFQASFKHGPRWSTEDLKLFDPPPGLATYNGSQSGNTAETTSQSFFRRKPIAYNLSLDAATSKLILKDRSAQTIVQTGQDLKDRMAGELNPRIDDYKSFIPAILGHEKLRNHQAVKNSGSIDAQIDSAIGLRKPLYNIQRTLDSTLRTSSDSFLPGDPVETGKPLIEEHVLKAYSDGLLKITLGAKVFESGSEGHTRTASSVPIPHAQDNGSQESLTQQIAKGNQERGDVGNLVNSKKAIKNPPIDFSMSDRSSEEALPKNSQLDKDIESGAHNIHLGTESTDHKRRGSDYIIPEAEYPSLLYTDTPHYVTEKNTDQSHYSGANLPVSAIPSPLLETEFSPLPPLPLAPDGTIQNNAKSFRHRNRWIRETADQRRDLQSRFKSIRLFYRSFPSGPLGMDRRRPKELQDSSQALNQGLFSDGIYLPFSAVAIIVLVICFGMTYAMG